MLEPVARHVIDPDYTSPWQHDFLSWQRLSPEERDIYRTMQDWLYLNWSLKRAQTFNQHLKDLIS